MSATDELRAMLDKRGVKWLPIAWNPKRETFYHAANGVGFCADEYTDGVKIYTDATITPEQAVEATLGRGECHDEGTFHSWGYFTCSNCKVVVPVEAVREAPSIGKVVPISFCPNCGRKVVDE